MTIEGKNLALTRAGELPKPGLGRHRGMSASEAVVGFAAWIMSREEIVTAGSDQDCAPWAALVETFCKDNGLLPPRSKHRPYLKSSDVY